MCISIFVHILLFLILGNINILQFLSAIDHVTMLALSARERESPNASNERRNEKEKMRKKRAMEDG